MLLLWMFSAVGQNDIEMSRGLRAQFQTRNEASGAEDNESEGRYPLRMLEQGWSITVLPQEIKKKGKDFLVLFLLLILQMSPDT